MPNREDLRHYLFPFVIRSQIELSSQASQAKCQQNSSDKIALEMSIGSLNESGYDGDREDEGETMCEDVMDEDDELFWEFGDQGQGMINKQSGDASFLCMDDFGRASSTPSIVQDSSNKEMDDSFQEEPIPMEFDHGPVMMDNQIHSANACFAPIPISVDEAAATNHRGGERSGHRVHGRVPLKSLENVDNVSLPRKPHRRKGEHTWKTRRSRNMLS